MFKTTTIDVITALAIRGNAICRISGGMTPGVGVVVLNDPTLNFNIQPGHVALITQIVASVETASDDCLFEFGYVDAGGVFHIQCGRRLIVTGAATAGKLYTLSFHPPAVMRYSLGARRVTWRVTANDAACVISMGYHGVFASEAVFDSIRI